MAEKNMQAAQVWQAALGELQLQMTKPTFDTWLKNTSLISYEDGTFVIGVHNAYAKDWLENRLLSIIKRALVGIVGRSVEVKFVVWPRERAASKRSAGTQELGPLLSGDKELTLTPPRAKSPAMLNPKYTFETFVVGPSNRLAHAASLAVAENPADAYNPLFIYGGVGLGKTHLLQAIGHVCQRKALRVLYVSSEEFTNDLINSIRNHTTEHFRDKYRTIDILLVDDIQFIAGKESTQEEFFHTFNTLYAANKQIVISSDRPPKAILTLEERLRSRFEGGLIADIQPPDLETRIAILRFKAEAQPLSVPDEVIDLIAHRVLSNVRELEGALNRVVAYAKLTGRPLTLEVASVALRDLLPRRESISLEQILEAVASFYGVKVEDLKGRRRSKELVRPRQMAMYLMREEVKASLPQIGEALGGRDHTTVLYGHRKICDQIERDEGLRRELLAIKERLYNRSAVKSAP